MKWLRKLFSKLPCRHDWDMEFPDEASFNWMFICKKCGKTKNEFPWRVK